MPDNKKLFLIDAMALIYRAYFAFQRNPRINSQGFNTSAVFGFANALWDVIRNEKPTHIGVAFDSYGPTVRHDDFAEYKANREAMPETIQQSIPLIKQFVEALNIPILILGGYEADDIIGTFAKEAEKRDFQTFMMTPDKDFGQLVSENIFMFKPGRMGKPPETLGVDEICTKYKIKHPEQFIDILGLWGDASDNIPGIPGIGEKTASKLIAEFDSVENLIANADKLKGKQKENVIEFAEQGLMSKMLATIILDVPIEFDEEALIIKDFKEDDLKSLFAELEFVTFGNRMLSGLAQLKGQPLKEEQQAPTMGNLFSEEEQLQDINSTKHDYKIVESPEGIKNLIDELQQQKEFCFDTETTALNAQMAELVGISFSFKAGQAFYVPIPENYHEAKEITEQFRELFESKSIVKIGQNLKYDISILNWYDIEVQAPLFDTMIAHYLIAPDSKHGMDFLAQKYLNYAPVSIEKLIGKKGSQQSSMRSVPIKTVAEYAGEDADITWQLKEILEKEAKEKGVMDLLLNMEVPLIPVLSSMENEGVRLDPDALKDFSKELGDSIKILQDQIHELAGVNFNIASPKQMGEVLFGQMKIVEKPRKTKTGQYSTGEEILRRLVNKHPIIEKILEFRSLTKLKSTYVDTLPGMINPRTQRIHTSYNQAVAATGRLSSNNPNLQNIPIRTEKGREIRKAFIPRNNDHTLLSADYSQIELRLIAELSQDEAMLGAFKNDLDIHTATAAKVYGVELDEVSSEQRRNAKMVNFGIIYGISAFGLSERLNIPRKEAAEIIEAYFTQYKGIKTYMNTCVEKARELGYVETIMKRRRYLNDINSGNATVRGFAERNAINAPIQGSSADMIKIAMINTYQEMKNRKLQSKMILQVHDELIFDVYKPELEEMKILVDEKMKNAIKLEVPIIVEMDTGDNWLEAH